MFWNCCLNIGIHKILEEVRNPKLTMTQDVCWETGQFKSSLTMDTINFKTRFLLYLVWVESLVDRVRRIRFLWLSGCEILPQQSAA